MALERSSVFRITSAAPAHEPRTITSVVNPRSAGGSYDHSSDADYWWPGPARYDGSYVRLAADPTVEEVRRDFPIRQPVLWVRPLECSSPR